MLALLALYVRRFLQRRAARRALPTLTRRQREALDNFRGLHIRLAREKALREYCLAHRNFKRSQNV